MKIWQINFLRGSFIIRISLTNINDNIYSKFFAEIRNEPLPTAFTVICEHLNKFKNVFFFNPWIVSKIHLSWTVYLNFDLVRLSSLFRLIFQMSIRLLSKNEFGKIIITFFRIQIFKIAIYDLRQNQMMKDLCNKSITSEFQIPTAWGLSATLVEISHLKPISWKRVITVNRYIFPSLFSILVPMKEKKLRF